MVPLTHKSESPDLTIFAQLTRVPNTETDRHTDHATCDICGNSWAIWIVPQGRKIHVASSVKSRRYVNGPLTESREIVIEHRGHEDSKHLSNFTHTSVCKFWFVPVRRLRHRALYLPVAALRTQLSSCNPLHHCPLLQFQPSQMFLQYPYSWEQS